MTPAVGWHEGHYAKSKTEQMDINNTLKIQADYSRTGSIPLIFNSIAHIHSNYKVLLSPIKVL